MDAALNNQPVPPDAVRMVGIRKVSGEHLVSQPSKHILRAAPALSKMSCFYSTLKCIQSQIYNDSQNENAEDLSSRLTCC